MLFSALNTDNHQFYCLIKSLSKLKISLLEKDEIVELCFVLFVGRYEKYNLDFSHILIYNSSYM